MNIIRNIYTKTGQVLKVYNNSIKIFEYTPVDSSFAFVGPTSGNINVQSTNFTITPNNPFTGVVTVTPTGVGSLGLSPITLTFNNSSTSQSFSITPIIMGDILLTVTNDKNITNPSPIIYTVNAIVTTLFTNDWEDGVLMANSPNHFRFSEQKDVDRLTVISTGARQGSKCTRIEVRAGDGDAGNLDQERAEFYGPRGADNTTIFVTEASGIIQYEFSVKFDSTWQQIQPTSAGQWGIFWQIHPPSEFTQGTPTLSLSATDEITLGYRCGDVTNNPIKEKIALSDGTLKIGQWIDFKVTVKYSKTSNGFIKIERRNQGESNYITVLTKVNCATMSYSPLINNGSPGNEYLKTGLYRNAQTFTSILYLDNIIISNITI